MTCKTISKIASVHSFGFKLIVGLTAQPMFANVLRYVDEQILKRVRSFKSVNDFH